MTLHCKKISFMLIFVIPSLVPCKPYRISSSSLLPMLKLSRTYIPCIRKDKNTKATTTSKLKASLKVSPGKASPLGVSEVENGINFAIFSKMHLLENVEALGTNMIEIVLDPSKNKTGDIWHICVEGLNSGIHYGYRIDGPNAREEGHRYDNSTILLDPYAKLVEGRRYFGDSKNKISKFLGTYDFSADAFDWGPDYKLPNIAEKDLIIYEMNVRAFTAHESSGLDASIRGSYLGVIEKIPHLLELGINAVELLPVFEFDEMEFQRRPNPRDHMVLIFIILDFSFFPRYASNGGGPQAASYEFKEMVKALHHAGIEVILDVVYNHTNEAGGFVTSFRGIDNKVYYMLDFKKNARLLNFSGCGNTLNCNHPVVMELILDSLRHWYHISEAFFIIPCGWLSFDLASVLCRGTDGAPLNSPPLVKAIAKDPVLSRCKIIAEPWDCGGLYLVGKFPNWDRWAEWNGQYRDDVRRFVKGDPGTKGSFASRVSGSSDLYMVNNRKPFHSINFVIAHDGFSLYDLVSYNVKHNDDNGEDGRDGSNDNFSWNCGHEGETDDIKIQGLRSRQMKNFHLTLLVSQGTPMMLMGDEYGHTRYGNNNSYGHDTAINHFLWHQMEERRSTHFRFFSEMNKFRQKHCILGRDRFLGKKDVTWHEDNWTTLRASSLHLHGNTMYSLNKTILITYVFSPRLHDEKLGNDIYLAFNAHDYVVKATIPSAPNNKGWHRVADTNLESPDDFIAEGIPFCETVYNVAPFSSIILQAKPK
ncbi:unnamed protein product [Spirodela intermedia]|uniref:isoamylase n=1 Tax=Spirodela intermedia TaxID=51605 RepID=A0A7I8J2J0_SPIIN|nr:unnamed protein product [Spirodela intermedia]CAA6664368.1 unnamed protein product [Spirodela intermedia]